MFLTEWEKLRGIMAMFKGRLSCYRKKSHSSLKVNGTFYDTENAVSVSSVFFLTLLLSVQKVDIKRIFSNILDKNGFIIYNYQ